jgi:hypothetical protein
MVFGLVLVGSSSPRTLPSLPYRSGAQTPDRTEISHNKSLPKRLLLPLNASWIMSEARDRKMKRERKFQEQKAQKVLRACRFRRFDENR